MTMRRFLAALVLSLVSLGASSANAGSKVDKAFKELKAERAGESGILIVAITGAGVAFAHANGELNARGAALLYCQPLKLGLTGLNYADIALAEFERHRSFYQGYKDSSTEAMVHAPLNGLVATFPCK